MGDMRTTIDGNRLLHLFRTTAQTEDACEWLMDETAARGTVTVVAQELDDVVETMYGCLDYAVRLATGVPKKLLSEEPGIAGTPVELRVARPCRVVCGIPVDAPEGLFACAVLAMGLAESIDASMELLKTNLSMRKCRTERDLEKMINHARKFRADAIVVVMPALVEMDVQRLLDRLEAVARSLNAAVLVVESFSNESFNVLASLPSE
jgi:hypothetical protein